MIGRFRGEYQIPLWRVRYHALAKDEFVGWQTGRQFARCTTQEPSTQSPGPGTQDPEPREIRYRVVAIAPEVTAPKSFRGCSMIPIVLPQAVDSCF